MIKLNFRKQSSVTTKMDYKNKEFEVGRALYISQDSLGCKWTIAKWKTKFKQRGECIVSRKQKSRARATACWGGREGGKKECCPAMLPDPGSSELCLIPCGIHCEVAFPLEDGCTGSSTTFSNFRPSGTMEKKICVLFTSPSKNLHCVPLAQVWIRWWSLTGYWSVGIECSDWLKPNNMFTLKLDLEWMSLDPQNQE